MLDSFFNAIFGGLIAVSPLWAVTFISFILTLLVTLIYKWTTNQAALKALKEELKGMRKEMKDYKEDPKKMMELQKKSMEKSLEQMKHSLKPMLFTFIPIILIFGWLRGTFPTGEVILYFPFDIPKPGPNNGFGWLGVYILSSIIFSIVLRKVLKVH